MQFFVNFEIDEHSGNAFTADERIQIQSQKLWKLQKIAFIHFKDSLENLLIASHADLACREKLEAFLQPLTDEQLRTLCNLLDIRTERLSFHCLQENQTVMSKYLDRNISIEALINEFEKRSSRIQDVGR